MTASFYINLFRTPHDHVVLSDHGAPHEAESEALEDIVLHEAPIGSRQALEYWCTLLRHHDGELEEVNLRRAAYERRSIKAGQYESLPLPKLFH